MGGHMQPVITLRAGYPSVGRVSQSDAANAMWREPVRTRILCIALLCLLQGCGIPGAPKRPIFRESIGDPNTAAMVQLDQLQYHAQLYAAEHRNIPANLNAFTARRPGDRVDPWGREIIYRAVGTTYELRSAGADGVEPSDDDVVIWGIGGHRRPCRLRHANGLIVDPASAPPACAELRRRADTTSPGAHRP